MNESPDDINARLAETEAQLKQWDECFSVALSQAGSAVYRRDFESDCFEFISPSIEALTGYSPQEFSIELWDSIVEHSVLLGESEQTDPAAALELFRRGETSSWHAEARFRTKSGEERWVLDLSTALHDPESGRPIASVGILQDITELKELEHREQALHERLERSRRMESLGLLAGSVAHDLNNILVPIVAYPELILRETVEGSRIGEFAKQIERAGHRAGTVVSNLLSLARQEVIELAPVNLNHMIEQYANGEPFRLLVSKTRGVVARTDLAADLPVAMADEGALSKVLVNLATNAVDFMPNGGRLTIKTSLQRIADNDDNDDGLAKGEYVVLDVSDTGCGFDTEDLPRIFEPFYTKKLLGRNASGLALAVAYGLVNEQNGYLIVNSEIGSGSTFSVYIPVAENTQEVERDVPLSDNYEGTETILLVDDDESARTAACRFLERYGYTVLTAEHGRQAVEMMAAEDSSPPIPLVLLDMIMEEGFDGLDTYKAILETHPGQRCLLVSGYAETERVLEALALGAGRLIRKPFTVEELCKAVRQELDRPAVSANA